MFSLILLRDLPGAERERERLRRGNTHREGERGGNPHMKLGSTGLGLGDPRDLVSFEK